MSSPWERRSRAGNSAGRHHRRSPAVLDKRDLTAWLSNGGNPPRTPRTEVGNPANLPSGAHASTDGESADAGSLAVVGFGGRFMGRLLELDGERGSDRDILPVSVFSWAIRCWSGLFRPLGTNKAEIPWPSSRVTMAFPTSLGYHRTMPETRFHNFFARPTILSHDPQFFRESIFTDESALVSGATSCEGQSRR
jgi:hypothetical protein